MAKVQPGISRPGVIRDGTIGTRTGARCPRRCASSRSCSASCCGGRSGSQCYFTRYGADGWACTQAAPEAGEQPVGGVYVKERCTKTIQGRALVVERNLFRQAGQDERSFVDETRVTILRARSERNGFELNRFGQALLPHGPHSVRECPSSRQESNGISIRLASGNSLSFFVVRLGREPFNPQAEENLRPSTAPVSHQKRFHITNR